MALHAEADSAEAVIFNNIIDLLDRQRDGEDVSAPLRVLLRQVRALYESKKANFALCQMGIGLACIGLGEHREARDMIANAMKIERGNPGIITNALIGLLHIGEVRAARAEAREVLARFAGHPKVLFYTATVLEATLDFAGLYENALAQAKLEGGDLDASDNRGRAEFAQEMAARASDLGYSADQLLDILETAIGQVKAQGHRLHWVNFRGRNPGAIRVELSVDGDADRCAHLNFSIADGLVAKYGDRVADELFSIAAKTYRGRAGQGQSTRVVA